MKKKTIIFFVYCVLIIGALVLFLIFSPKFIDKSSDDSSTPSENDIVYATKIALNCDDSITVTAGTSVQFLSGYISVEPSSYLNTMDIDITAKTGTINGILFSNNLLLAYDEGIYTIQFSVPKSENTSIFDTLTITVVSPSNDTKVEQLKNSLTESSVVGFSEVFNVDDTYTYEIETNDYITYTENQIEFIQSGETSLNLNLMERYLIYNYVFNFVIKERVDYTIDITNEVNGVLEFTTEIGKSAEIYYNVKALSGEYVSQDIRVEINDGSVAEFLYVEVPCFTIKCLNKGSVNITITSTEFENLSKIITVIFN